MKLAIVRIRGDVKVLGQISDALKILGLKKKNHCVIVEDGPSIQGTLRKVEPLVTWGNVDEKTISALQKKGEKVFRLGPPRKGYGRKGVKMPFKLSGAYGNRGEKINDLIMRMV